MGVKPGHDAFGLHFKLLMGASRAEKPFHRTAAEKRI
jgi:hypothetical protein